MSLVTASVKQRNDTLQLDAVWCFCSICSINKLWQTGSTRYCGKTSHLTGSLRKWAKKTINKFGASGRHIQTEVLDKCLISFIAIVFLALLCCFQPLIRVVRSSFLCCSVKRIYIWLGTGSFTSLSINKYCNMVLEITSSELSSILVQYSGAWSGPVQAIFNPSVTVLIGSWLQVQ